MGRGKEGDLLRASFSDNCHRPNPWLSSLQDCFLPVISSCWNLCSCMISLCLPGPSIYSAHTSYPPFSLYHILPSMTEFGFLTPVLRMGWKLLLIFSGWKPFPLFVNSLSINYRCITCLHVFLLKKKKKWLLELETQQSFLADIKKNQLK